MTFNVFVVEPVKTLRTVPSILLLFLSFMMLSSCRHVPVSVCDLNQNPRKYASREFVTTRGYVTESTNLLFVKYYMIKDMQEDCSLIIITDRMLPEEGRKITVKGVLEEAYKLGDDRLLVLREKD